MKNKTSLLLSLLSVLLFSCVSSKKFKDEQAMNAELNTKYSILLGEYNDCQKNKTDLSAQKSFLETDKGVVYIDISDKLLFKTGKYDVSDEAKVVLGKVAMVLKNQPDIEFMVEGHTDNVPFKSSVLLDNWDLSVKRATSVVRILQN